MNDVQAMERCIELARAAFEHGNNPFGSVIVRDGQVVDEAENSVMSDLDPSAHAEVMVIRKACRTLGRLDLSDCWLYTSCEPCWMCSTAIRLSGISRVAFGATYSPTGGYTSAWPVLRDGSIPRFRFPPPEVLPALLADRAEAFLAEIGWPGPIPPH